MDNEFFLVLILDIALTAFGYLLVPTIYCLRKKPLTAKKIKRIIILNAICVCLIFLIIRLAAGGDASASVAVWLWSWVGHVMMKKHLLIEEKPELDADITPDEVKEDSIDNLKPNNDNENKEESIAEITTTISEETVTVNKTPSKCFCRKCGNEIDSTTKKCTGCGKQYFRGIKYYLKTVFTKKRILPIVLSVLLIFSLICNIVQTVDINSYKNLVQDQYKLISIRNSTIANKNSEISKLEINLRFYERHAVIVPDDGSNLYHKYGCNDLDTSSFWIYNVEAAKGKGYVPHKKCCG